MTTTLEPTRLETAFARWGTNFATFCTDVLGYKDLIAPHHELCQFLQQPGNKLILMPRYSFKSSLCTVAYSLWTLTRNTDARVLIYSDTNEKAEGFLGEIKHHLAGQKAHSTFREAYGAWEVDPKQAVWNQAQIVVKVRRNAAVEPSIDTAGIETSKVGMHYDLIIFDDIVTEKNVTTKDQMDKVHECYRKALSLLKPGGQVLMVGTRWHFGDLYGRLLAQLPVGWASLVRAAKEGDTYPFAATKLTPEFLAQQKAIQGTRLFSAIYQNNPTDDETATFKSTNFAFYAQRPERLYLTCTLDPIPPPASDHGDDAAITVVGTDAEGDWYLVDAVAGRLDPSKQLDEVFRLHAKWGFRVVGLETNAFQRMLKVDLERRIAEKRKSGWHPFQVVEFTGRDQRSKETRIQGLEPLHERRAMKFPGERLELLQGVWSDLAYQMLQFPHSPKDDLLDSLARHLELSRREPTLQQGEEYPYSSAKWFEREWFAKQRQVRARLPRWHRPPLPAPAFC